MINESKVDYHRRREREERDAADVTQCDVTRDTHNLMAELHGTVALKASLVNLEPSGKTESSPADKLEGA